MGRKRGRHRLPAAISGCASFGPGRFPCPRAEPGNGVISGIGIAGAAGQTEYVPRGDAGALFSPNGFSLDGEQNGQAMTEKDKRGDKGAVRAKETRQDRLKLALRENLKRRKSQTRERGKSADAPSTEAELSLHEDAGKRGG